MNGDGSTVEKSSRERVSSGLLQAITLDDIATGIAELVELARARIPEGRLLPLPLTGTTDLQIEEFRPALFSIIVTNDDPVGGQDLLFAVRRSDRMGPLKPGETIHLDFGIAKIDHLFYRVESGTVPFRLLGVF